MTKPTHTPFYRQIIVLLRNALSLLDEQGRKEVLEFLISQQNPDGGFRDRGGQSDLYYSLFGGLMLRAAEKKAVDEKQEAVDRASIPELVEGAILNLKKFIAGQSNSNVPGFIEKCCLVLLQQEVKTGRNSQIKAFVALGKSFWKERHSINISYRSFVLFLTLEAALPVRKLLMIGAKRMLRRSTIDQHSPCSEVAASVFLQKMMGQDGSEDQKLLKSFARESGGFKAFAHLDNADMLSTAVALFALNYADCDLRLLKPISLDFIGRNFAEGAFLSGDGDPTADVEYTFYGLLALGVLAD